MISEIKILISESGATETISTTSSSSMRSLRIDDAGSDSSMSSLRTDDAGSDKYATAIAKSAWAHCNESSNDFRSDFLTKPTLPMLEAIISSSLGDGDMGEDKTTESFQNYVADLVGHEASILVMTGSMGNQVALRTALTTPPFSIVADHRGHIINWESGGASALCGALIKGVVPSNGHHLTLEDVKKNACVTETYYDAPTRVISLENTLAGTIMPLSDIRDISEWARAQQPPIHMHLDGARLWEAVTAGAFTLREIGECFDSIQLCLTKGLGAPVGSVVTGTKRFIKRAIWARKHLGGSIRASGMIAAPARVAIDDVFLGVPRRMRLAQDKARRATALWEKLGGKFTIKTETNMVWLDIPGSGLTLEHYNAVASRFPIKVGEPLHGRLCFHYQISDQAFSALCEFFKAVLKKPTTE
jgi:threonine aldolase